MTDVLFNAVTGNAIGLIEHLTPEEVEAKIAEGYALTAIAELPDEVRTRWPTC